MKAVSLIQPYATLVLAGAKRYETRSWSTNHRGPLVIHASRTVLLGIQHVCAAEPFRSALRAAGYESAVELPRGALLGTVELLDVISTDRLDLSRLSPEEIAFGDFGPGRYGWLLSNPRLLNAPVPWPGQLGLFAVEIPQRA